MADKHHQTFYALFDTATRTDVLYINAFHIGDAYARLASVVIGMQRISFELHEIGKLVVSDEGLLSVESTPRKYICSASQAMLDSHFEDAGEYLDPSSEVSPDVTPIG